MEREIILEVNVRGVVRYKVGKYSTKPNPENPPEAGSDGGVFWREAMNWRDLDDAAKRFVEDLRSVLAQQGDEVGNAIIYPCPKSIACLATYIEED